MPVSRTERGTAGALLVVGAFQLALAAGAPWARAAYGGGHDGVLPRHLRMLSAATALGYGSGALLVLRGSGSPAARSTAFTALSVAMGVGTLANAASRSRVERTLWTPVAAVTAWLAWRSRGPR
jgi:hypothetical protein